MIIVFIIECCIVVTVAIVVLYKMYKNQIKYDKELEEIYKKYEKKDKI